MYYTILSLLLITGFFIYMVELYEKSKMKNNILEMELKILENRLEDLLKYREDVDRTIEILNKDLKHIENGLCDKVSKDDKNIE